MSRFDPIIRERVVLPLGQYKDFDNKGNVEGFESFLQLCIKYIEELLDNSNENILALTL